MSAHPDSLEAVLDYLAQNNTDDDKIYQSLAQLDAVRLRRTMRGLARVEAAAWRARKTPRPKGKRDKAAFEGQRSALKGRLYEQLVKLVVDGVQCFASVANVHSSTNELDILVVLGPRALWVPAMREWGSHCVCECKYHNSHISTDWVTKLNTVLQTHHARVGLLFSRKGVAATGRGTHIRHALQLLAAGRDPRFIIPLTWDDLMRCTDGENFLKLVVHRYIEITAGLERLGLAASP